MSRRGSVVPSARALRVGVAVAAVLVAVLGSGALIWSASGAAFSATTSTPASAWAAGSVRLTDDDGGTALFTAAGLKPGQTIVNCIKATYAGSVPAAVRLYATRAGETSGSGGTGLLPFVHLTVEEGTGGAYGCGGFTGAATVWDAAAHPGAASGVLGDFPATYAQGLPSGPASWVAGDFRVYRLTLTVDGAIPDAAQGASAAVAFTWEARS